MCLVAREQRVSPGKLGEPEAFVAQLGRKADRPLRIILGDVVADRLNVAFGLGRDAGRSFGPIRHRAIFGLKPVEDFGRRRCVACLGIGQAARDHRV